MHMLTLLAASDHMEKMNQNQLSKCFPLNYILYEPFFKTTSLLHWEFFFVVGNPLIGKEKNPK